MDALRILSRRLEACAAAVAGRSSLTSCRLGDGQGVRDLEPLGTMVPHSHRSNGGRPGRYGLLVGGMADGDKSAFSGTLLDIIGDHRERKPEALRRSIRVVGLRV